MKLDRNINADGTGKYALVLMRETPSSTDVSEKAVAIRGALQTLEHHGCLDYGNADDRDFFVIRLKDKFAPAALFAYSVAAEDAGEKEWALEVRELAHNAANRTNQKLPD